MQTLQQAPCSRSPENRQSKRRMDTDTTARWTIGIDFSRGVPAPMKAMAGTRTAEGNAMRFIGNSLYLNDLWGSL
jgi:hypothetical protein